MAEIVVNPTASSNGSGSLLDPKNTYTGLTTNPGDTVLQVAGTTHHGRLRPGANGTAGARITYGVCNPQTGERVYGQGLAKVQGSAGQHGADFLTFIEYITLDSLELVGGAGNQRNGINLLGTNSTTAVYLEVLNCIARGGVDGDVGIALRMRGRGLTVRNSWLTDSASDTALLTTSDTLFEDVLCTNFDSDRSGTGDGIQFNTAADVGNTLLRRVRIIGHRDNPVKQCLIANGTAGTFIIEDSEFFGMGVTVQLEIPGSVIRRSKIWGSTVRGLSMARNDCKAQELHIHDTPNAILCASTYTGQQIDNCTLFAQDECVNVGGTATATMRNNALRSNGYVYRLFDTSGSIASSNDNRFATGSKSVRGATEYLTLAALQAAESCDAASQVVDLMTTDDGRPLPGSPLLTGGANLGLRRDIRGRLARRFVGAYGPAVLLPSFP